MLNFNFSEHVSTSTGTVIVIFLFLALFFIITGHAFSKLDPEKDDVPTKGPLFIAMILVDVINKFTRNNLGQKYVKPFAPYLLGISSMLLLGNLSSLFGLTPPVTNLAVALSMSVLAFMTFEITSIRYMGLKGKIKSLLGPVPAVSPLILPISIIGEFTTPFSMGLRLFGNIFSGVLLCGILIGAAEALGVFLGSLISVTFIAVLIHPLFDIAFGLIQMYIYLMLTTMFIKQNANID